MIAAMIAATSEAMSGAMARLAGAAALTVTAMSVRRRVAPAVRAVALAVVLLAAATALPAQAPDEPWRTIDTEHFRVHFTPELEELARRTAGNAERAYGQLAAELPAPRGLVDLVVADNVDYSNGSATPFPSNRIVIFAHPPVDVPSLRFYDEWSALVVTHELTHIFHLDRTRGWWRAAQYVFGRSPFLFPNQYLPAWAVEGIAVYYESRLTGSGRIAGTQHRTMARAAMLGGHFPGVADLSLATPHFPGGEQSYALGGLFVDHLARTRGAGSVPRFIDAVAGDPIPFLLDRDARRGFGVSFRSAWRGWRDSIQAGLVPGATVASGSSPFAELVDRQWQARGPRWRDAATLVAGLNPGREMPGAYAIGVDGAVTRLGRRNDGSPQVPLADGGLLYAQLDFLDPYRLRSDLYVSRGGRETRLTSGARLFRPDARADGSIVAVQAVAGTTRLVRVSADGATIAPITSTDARVQWTEPRWSPDGRRIAAVRWSAGGLAEVVVLDTAGRVEIVAASARAVQAAPSWSPDGGTLYYASDSSGRAELYRVVLPARQAVGGTATGTATSAGATLDHQLDHQAAGDGQIAVPRPERLSATATGLFDPSSSPDGERLAAVRYQHDGWAVVVAPLGGLASSGADSAAGGGGDDAWRARYAAVAALPPAAPLTVPSRAYSPWRTLVPRYWVPLVRAGDRDETFVGASTSARDVIGRHGYTADAFVGTGSGLVEGSATYRYAGFGRPLLDAAVVQDWQRLALRRGDGSVAGERRRRTRTLSAAAVVQRPRVRTNAWGSLGVELEQRVYTTDPAPLIEQLGEFYREPRVVPAAQLSAGWSNTQRPTLAISVEDGVALSGTVRQRWLDGDVRPITRSAVGTLAAYRSLPGLPGFAHHVLAARVAGGWADDGATSEFEAGGVSGGSIELFPGVVVGEGQRTFGVRGVPAATLYGTRAAAGSVEYRAPLAAPGRGIARLPLFIDRASLVVFGDAATAWCPPSAAGRPACLGAPGEARWLTSVGAELDLDVALQYDVGYRGRLGVAFPRPDAAAGVSGGARVFVAVGRSF
ncbi:MAG: hypothetical protein ACYC2G_02800 [Gemmatimonadaceae bacterium]